MSGQNAQYEQLLDSLYEGLYFVDRARKITFWNRAAEALTGFSKEELLGRSCADEVLVHVDTAGNRLCLGGCPVAGTIEDGESREADVFLRHKDGHRIPVKVRVAPVYDDHGEIQGAVEIFEDNTALLELLQQLRDAEKDALLDALTGIPNRRYLDQSLDGHMTALARHGWSLGLLMVDIDHFKSFNDSYGHDVGDRVIKLVARTLEHNLRGNDLLGRWGGEEFLVILPGATAEALEQAAERLRIMVEGSSMVHDTERLGVTISVGGTLARRGESADSALRRADGCLYQAKDAGRNQVCVSQPLEG